MNIDQAKVDNYYEKVLQFLNAGHLKLARELLNVTTLMQNNYGIFNDPLYACLSNEQFLMILSDSDVQLGKRKVDRVESLSRNGLFIVVYGIDSCIITIRNAHLVGSLSYQLTNTDMNKRKRRFILDLCLN